MQAEDIERHLTQLGQELTNRDIKKPIRVLMIGGAYMLLLARMQRSADDIDIFWLDESDAFQQATDAFRKSVQAVAEKYQLEPDWFNYMAHLLMYDMVKIPKGMLWKRFGPLHVYVPPKTYILALKILAGREKDIEDCRVLLQDPSENRPKDRGSTANAAFSSIALTSHVMVLENQNTVTSAAPARSLYLTCRPGYQC